MRKLYICEYSTDNGRYYWDMRCYRYRDDAEKRADRLKKQSLSVRFVHIHEVLPCWEPGNYERETRARLKAQLENYRLRNHLRDLLNEVLDGATEGLSRKRCREAYDKTIGRLAAIGTDLSKLVCLGD